VTAPTDASVAETAAAVENVLLAAYGKLSGLPALQQLGLEPFFVSTIGHHADHAAAFNAAAARLGGKPQSGLDQPFMTSVVQPGLADVASATDAVLFSARLETIAAATYASQVATVADRDLRAVLAGVAGVECQHQGVLFVAVSLLAAGSATVGGFPVAARRLPPTLQGPPVAFLRTDQARPVAEGAAP
jgi:Ferritin-like domain